MAEGIGTGGSKFVIQFTIEGSGKKDLQEVSKLFDNIGTKLDKNLGDKAKEHTEGLSDNFFKMGGALQGAMSVAAHGLEIFDSMAEAGNKISEAGSAILEGTAKGFEQLMEKGSEFEQMILRIQGTGQDHAHAMQTVKDAVAFTKELPITEMDAVRIAQTMATVHIDALARIGESYSQLAAKGKTMKGIDEYMGVEKMNKEGPRAVTVIGDMLAATGNLGGAYQGQAIHELMEFVETGMAKSQRAFGPYITGLKEISHKAHDAKGRLAGMVELLEKRGALGLSQAAMGTMGGVMSNFKGLMDQITLAVMEPGKKGGIMSQITKGLSDMYSTIAEYFDTTTEKGKATMTVLRDIGTMIVDKVVVAMKMLGEGIKFVMNFISKHPDVTKFAVAFTLVSAAVAVATGVFITASAVIGGVVLTLVAFPALLLAPIGLFLALAAAVVGFTAAGAGALLVGKNWDSHFGGMKKFFEGIKFVIDGVSEALDHWDSKNTAITRKTAEGLEKTGMLDFFYKVIGAMRGAQIMWEQVSDALSSKRGSDVVQQLEEAVDSVGQALGRVWDATELVLESLGILPEKTSTVNDAKDSADNWAQSILNVGSGVAGVIKWFSGLVGTVADVVRGFSVMYAVFEAIKIIISSVGDVIRIAVIAPLMTMFHLLKDSYNIMNSSPGKIWDNIKNLGNDVAGDWKGTLDNFGNTATDLDHASNTYDRMNGTADRLAAQGQKADAVPEVSTLDAFRAREQKEQINDLFAAMNFQQPSAPGGKGGDVKHTTITNILLDSKVLATAMQEHDLKEKERGGFLPQFNFDPFGKGA